MISLLRATVFNLIFYTVTPMIALAGTILRAAGHDRSLECARLWSRWMQAIARRLCGIHVVVTGAEHLPRQGAALLACQHYFMLGTCFFHPL